MTNSTEAIERLRKAEKLAAKGPWKIEDCEIYSITEETYIGCDEGPTDPEGIFICEARNTTPLLLAEYDRLKQQNASLRAALKEVRQSIVEGASDTIWLRPEKELNMTVCEYIADALGEDVWSPSEEKEAGIE